MGNTWPYEVAAAHSPVKSPNQPGTDGGTRNVPARIVTLEGKREPKAAFPAGVFGTCPP
jgi:hypothetical protein